MSKENRIWIAVMGLGVLLVIIRVLVLPNGMGNAYVRAVEHDKVRITTDGEQAWVDAAVAVKDGVNVDALAADDRVTWTIHESETYGNYMAAETKDPGQGVYSWSLSRTIGIWIAAFFTLFVFSFLIKDNPLYKIAESVFVGASAAYWMVVAFWDTMVPNLFGKLAPTVIKGWAIPGLDASGGMELAYLVPLILGVMLLWRLMPVAGWISRWPMAFFIGTFCGLRLIRFLHADFLSQIRNGIVPLWVVEDGSFNFWSSLQNFLLVAGVLVCLVYFFFSIEHKGAVGQAARAGIWVLMITFGAAFGYTVMGRIALLAIRLEFLMDDWLWLFDATGRRAVESAATLWPLFGLT